MAVKLRLARHGAKRHPYYRIVAAEDNARRDGRFLEHVGSYDPNHNPPSVTLKRERVQHWLDRGANPTPTVKSLLGTYMGAEDSVRVARASYVPKDVPAEEAPAPAAAAADEAPAAEPTEEAAAPAAEEASEAGDDA